MIQYAAETIVTFCKGKKAAGRKSKTNLFDKNLDGLVMTVFDIPTSTVGGNSTHTNNTTKKNTQK